MDGMVYVVHCIDTEGPLYEAPEVPFEQIKKIYGIDIPVSEENLRKLQNGELNLDGKEEEIKNLVNVRRIATGGDWDAIDRMLERITSEEFRSRLTDCEGQGWKYSWFCMDHVGFTGKNPRRRDAGHHKIFDHYSSMVHTQNMGDIIQFHHHPVSHSGNFNESGTAFWGRSTLNDILTRKIIEREWFPVAFRPGFHTERADAHWFLEQWIPFDYGNQAVRKTATDQPDIADGRFGDWRMAPAEWKPYHPAYDNYQKKGSCCRWITRCLNMNARSCEITQEDVLEAFRLAEEEGKAVLAFTDHDYKDMEYEVNCIREFIALAGKKLPNVRFRYTDAVTAMREYCCLKPQEIGTVCHLISLQNGKKLIIQTKGDIFGSQPYLALKTKDGNYIWDNLDCDRNHQWSYTFDYNSILYETIEKIGVAVSNDYGYCEIMNYDTEECRWNKRVLNEG